MSWLHKTGYFQAEEEDFTVITTLHNTTFAQIQRLVPVETLSKLAHKLQVSSEELGSVEEIEKKVIVYLVNNYDNQIIDLYWLHHSGEEVFQETMHPGDSTSHITFVVSHTSPNLSLIAVSQNHMFVVRNSITSQYLSTIVVDAERFSDPLNPFPLYNQQRDHFAEQYLHETGHRWLAAYPIAPVVHSLMPMGSLPGDVRHVLLTAEARMIQSVALSVSNPKVSQVSNLLTAAERQALITAYLEHTQPDTMRYGESFVWIQHSAAVAGLQQVLWKVFDLVGFPFYPNISPLFAEPVLVRRLDSSRSVQYSHDFIAPYNEEFKIIRDVHQGRNRFVSVYVFLNGLKTDELENEGSVIFWKQPRNEKHRLNAAIARAMCGDRETGDGNYLRVKAEEGKAIVYYNMLEDGNYDEFSEIIECAIAQNDAKYVAEFRFWNPYRESDIL